MPDLSQSTPPSLPMIDDVEPFSPDRDQQCFEELRAVLARHGALGRFGVCLLHEHFRIEDDEVLVETVDITNKTLTICPARQSEVDRESMETNWRLDGSEAEPKIRCIQKCIPAGKDAHGKGHFTSVH